MAFEPGNQPRAPCSSRLKLGEPIVQELFCHDSSHARPTFAAQHPEPRSTANTIGRKHTIYNRSPTSPESRGPDRESSRIANDAGHTAWQWWRMPWQISRFERMG